jgi:hypothetical protein
VALVITAYAAASPELRAAIDDMRAELAELERHQHEPGDRRGLRRRRQLARRAAEQLAEALGQEMA